MDLHEHRPGVVGSIENAYAGKTSPDRAALPCRGYGGVLGVLTRWSAQPAVSHARAFRQDCTRRCSRCAVRTPPPLLPHLCRGWGSPRPQLHQDPGSCHQICIGTGRPSPTSALRLTGPRRAPRGIAAMSDDADSPTSGRIVQVRVQALQGCSRCTPARGCSRGADRAGTCARGTSASRRRCCSSASATSHSSPPVRLRLRAPHTSVNTPLHT